MGQARAESGPRIIVFPADGVVRGKLQKAPATITSVVTQAAKASGARVDVAAGSAADAMTLAGCEAKQPACLGTVADTLDADLVVVISVAAANTGVFVDIDIGKRGASEPMRANWILDGADLAAIQKGATREATTLFSGDTKSAPPEPPAATEPAAPAADDAPPEPSPVATASKPADGHPSRFARVKTYSWITAGAGVVLMAGGAVFLNRAGNKQDEIDSASPSSLSDFRELESLEDDASSQATMGNIMLGAGIVAAGVGATLIVLQMRSSPDEEDVVSLAPAAFDHGAGVALTVLGDL